jgi:hypothetical protein
VAAFWPVAAARLDTLEMQKGTRAAGRVYPSYKVPAGSPNVPTGERWGRVILEAGTAAFPMTKISSLLRRVLFRLVTEVSDYHPADGGYWDPFIALEGMQEEGQRLLERWSPGVIRNPQNQPRLLVALPVWQEEEWQPTPQWNDQDNLWWLSSLYGFEAAAVTV